MTISQNAMTLFSAVANGPCANMKTATAVAAAASPIASVGGASTGPSFITTIVIGYGAGLFSAALGHLPILCGLIGFKREDAEFQKMLARMVYGTFCFGFFFTCLGTILGGIWANESWGRFWGWDPKENGALLIVLWQLAALHARAGGYIRNPGLSMAAVFNGMVIAFSWWGVNLLGIGLHSYGFGKGAVARTMIIVGGADLGFSVLCAGIYLIRRASKPDSTAAATA